MWEDVAYSQDLLRILLDPATWVIAIIAIFAQPHRSALARIAVAIVASVALSLVLYVLPAGETGRSYAWTALLYLGVATAIWAVALVLLQRFIINGRMRRGAGR
ncbi:MAG: hypothetical protein AB7S80_08485 [Rhizobiaceae bacterium]